MKRTLVSVLGVGFLVFLIWLVIPESPALSEGSSRSTPDPAMGKALYEANCARCHGPTGAGDGMDAKRMSPKPRQLSEGIFKFRTTASGTPPTDEDLFHTLSTGLPGSRMPDFQRLPEEARWQLVYYVKSLSPVFESQAPEPVDLGTPPPRTGALIQKGKELYTQLGCHTCHGNLGRGNGPSAPGLVDNWGKPIQAADLTKGWNYRAGSSAREIVARVMTGIDGAPMPSYADALSSKEDAWALAYYLESIQESPRFHRVIEAIPASDPLPKDPEDSIWEKAPRTDLRLASNLYRQGEILPSTVRSVSVQAVYNKEEILFRLAWNDPSENRTEPPDALAVAFIPDRRLKWRLGSLRGWSMASENLDLRRWSATEEGGSAAVYTDGRWVLLLRRPLPPKAPIPMGVAVWDGGNQESQLHRANSYWVDLVLR